MQKRTGTMKKPKRSSTMGNHSAYLLCVKDIMREYALSYQTVNHYTDFGLLPIHVKKGNVRFYDKRIVTKRMKLIRELMGEGYSLRLIGKKLAGT